MVGPTVLLPGSENSSLDRRLNLFAKMVYELRHGLKADPAERTTWNSHRSSAVGHRLLEEIEAVLGKFRFHDSVNPGSFGVVHVFPAPDANT